MRNTKERQNKILLLLEEKYSISVKELAARFQVSHMTIRRDIEELLKEEKVHRYHGGIRISRPNISAGYNLCVAEQEHHLEKKAIAMRALDFIEPGDTVFLDAGTTTELIARLLPENSNLTVVTTALNIINAVCHISGIKVIAAGGTYHKSSGVFSSPEAVLLLKKIRISKAFFSANALQFELGVTCSNQFEVECKRAALKSSLVKILVADSSKLGHVVSTYFADLSDFNRVIMDLPADKNLIQSCDNSPVIFDFADVV